MIHLLLTYKTSTFLCEENFERRQVYEEERFERMCIKCHVFVPAMTNGSQIGQLKSTQLEQHHGSSNSVAEVSTLPTSGSHGRIKRRTKEARERKFLLLIKIGRSSTDVTSHSISYSIIQLLGFAGDYFIAYPL